MSQFEFGSTRLKAVQLPFLKENGGERIFQGLGQKWHFLSLTETSARILECIESWWILPLGPEILLWSRATRYVFTDPCSEVSPSYRRSGSGSTSNFPRSRRATIKRGYRNRPVPFLFSYLFQVPKKDESLYGKRSKFSKKFIVNEHLFPGGKSKFA